MKPRYKIITMLGNKEYEYSLRGEIFVQDLHYKFVDMENLTYYFPIVTTIVQELNKKI